MASEKGCTAAQLALAWVLHQGQDIVAIPGSKRRTHLEDNAAAFQVELSTDDLARIDRILPPGAAAGERYAPAAMQALNR
jgi:aryl-alcohol dehydrogenase-like predicted oxidoreductase